MSKGYLIRPVQSGDIDDMYALSALTGAGFTSLQSDRPFLERLIQKSLDSFDHPQLTIPQTFLLVMEHLSSKKLIGCASVKTGIGSNDFMCADFEVQDRNANPVSMYQDFDRLYLKRTLEGATEIGSLFLHPGHRSGGAGRFLARSRYLLMASHPHLFRTPIVAQLRGQSDAFGASPFFDAVWSKRLGRTYQELDIILAHEGVDFILDEFGGLEVPINALPERALKAIGQPHKTASAALKLLHQEGFHLSTLIDLSDGGPIMTAMLEDIRSIHMATSVSLLPCEHAPLGDKGMLCRMSFKGFRACIGSLVQKGPNLIGCSDATIKMLEPGQPCEIMFSPGSKHLRNDKEQPSLMSRGKMSAHG